MAKGEAKKETRSKEEILQEINRHLDTNVFIPSFLEGIRIIPTGSDSKLLKDAKIDLSKVTKMEAMRLRNFLSSVDNLDSTIIVLKNKENGLYKLVQPKKSSRYFEDGRNKIRGKVFARLGHNKKVEGVFLTVTYDPKIISRQDAWKKVGEHTSSLLDHVNKIRKRKINAKKRLSYFWVVEEQKGTGYPHIHVFFPKLNWLMSEGRLKEIWKWGDQIKTKKANCNIANYITKYISKLKGYSLLGLAYMWSFRRRLYSFSRDFVVKVTFESGKYELVGMFNKNKGFAEFQNGKFEWLGLIDFEWFFDCDVGEEEKVFEDMDCVWELKSQLYYEGGGVQLYYLD